MKLAIGADKPTAFRLFEEKQKEEIVPGLTRRETDLIFDYLKGNNFDIRGIDQNQFPLEKLQIFAKQWSANIWARHAIPCAPHTKGSLDQQTSFREPLYAKWLEEQVEELRLNRKHHLFS